MLGQNRSKSVMQKQIPTVLGLIILIGALVAGLLFFGDGTGVFAPRATPEITPKTIRLTNVKENSFTVTFYTDEATVGFIKYGKEQGKLNSQSSDDRDQLSGTVEEYQLHHVTIRGLESNTEYFYVLGTGSKAEFDNEGLPFSVKTAGEPASGAPNALTIYGSVSNQSGTPAEGSIVYVSAADMGEMSSLIKSSGSWAIPLSQARTQDGSDYANLAVDDNISLLIQGLSLEERLQLQTTVGEAQPVSELTFGTEAINQTEIETVGADEEPEELSESNEIGAIESSDSADINEQNDDSLVADETDEESSSISGQLQDLLAEAEPLPQESTASTHLFVGELKETTGETEVAVFTTQTPIIKGRVEPNVEVKIEIHSESQYEETVTADENGEFELDLATLKATLEPGEHTVTYSYVDPDTGEEVVKTETFMVEDPDAIKLASAETDDSPVDDEEEELLAQADVESDIPYGSGDPYPMTSPTQSPSPTSSVATTSTDGAREQLVGTDSSLTQAGSIEATMLLVLAGIFFVSIGSWSWWLAVELEQED